MSSIITVKFNPENKPDQDLKWDSNSKSFICDSGQIGITEHFPMKVIIVRKDNKVKEDFLWNSKTFKKDSDELSYMTYVPRNKTLNAKLIINYVPRNED
jgi:hypothetical protein